MKWASVLSEQSSLESAVAECSARLQEKFGADPIDLAFLFVSPHFASGFARLPEMFLKRAPIKTFIGCSAAGIIGAGHEVEQRPALSLTAGRLPGVEMKVFHLNDQDLPDMDAGPRAWEKALGVEARADPQFVLLADPFSFRAENLTIGLDYAFPKSAKVGGLASGARGPGGNVLYAGGQAFFEGAVGVALSGDIVLDTVVAQGCRPIGSTLQITEVHDNVLLALNGQPPLQVLQEIYHALGQKDRELLQTSLFLGFLTNPLKMEINQEDFLIRNIIGVDSQRGSLVIGAELRVGQTVQFHLRDAETSADDLEQALSRYILRQGPSSLESALLFSCLGRGMHLYGRPDHDTDLFRSHAGPIPLGGFFCNGEIGPIGGTTYLHGYTSCFGIFRPPVKSGAL